MELREIRRSDYDLILSLDSKVYPVTEENKVSVSSIDRWYSVYPNYGMIYCNKITGEIVAMAIIIPMPISTWYRLKNGECFEHTLYIQWTSLNKSNKTNNDNSSNSNNNSNNDNNINNRSNKDSISNEETSIPISIGVHIYHIEVLDRSFVKHGFYCKVLEDLSSIARHYHHTIDALSGYCVTPSGNWLFQHILKCHNTDDDNEHDDTEPTSEFIVQHPTTGQIKIVVETRSTDIQQPYIDTTVQPAEIYHFISKCNMWYTLRNEDANISPVWNYL